MPSIDTFLDQVYYINLDHRNDRKEEFLREMRLIDMPEEKITRIPGIYIPEITPLGCTKSHILALETFLASSYETCAIFEDDFSFYSLQNVRTFFCKMLEQAPGGWDMLMLSGVVKRVQPTEYPFLTRVFDLQTSSSYCIRKLFAKILLENLKESAESLEYIFKATGRIEPSLCLDIYWKQLQTQYTWYLSNPILGFQRPSYSDIEKSFVTYVEDTNIFKDNEPIESNSSESMDIFHDYLKVVQESPPPLLLQIPHKRRNKAPSGFVVITHEEAPAFPFTICPLFFAKPTDTIIPGNHPHDVLVKWDSTKGSLERLLYTLYERYKDEGLESTDESMKRYIYEKKLPPRKIVIPTLRRRENLEVVLKRFREIHPPREGYHPSILVIEHSPNPEFEYLCERYNVEWMWFFLDPRVPHLPIGQFNKALCYDKAFLFGSPAEWYLFHDNDILVPKDFWALLDANVARSKTKFVQPYTHRCLLNLYEGPSENVRKNMTLIDGPIPTEIYAPFSPGAPGGSLYIHHDRYIEAGGHDPNYCWGYGPEDAFFFHKLGLLEPIAYADEPPIEMIHLWHPHAASQNPLYRCMDFLIKGHFMKQTLPQLQSYLDEKRRLLNMFLPEGRRRV